MLGWHYNKLINLNLIAAYEGFVHNTKTKNIEQWLALVSYVGSKC